VVRLVGMAHGGDGERRQMPWLGGRGEVLERVVMRHVIDQPVPVGRRIEGNQAVPSARRPACSGLHLLRWSPARDASALLEEQGFEDICSLERDKVRCTTARRPAEPRSPSVTSSGAP
jgi:hypothetical protein